MCSASSCAPALSTPFKLLDARQAPSHTRASLPTHGGSSMLRSLFFVSCLLAVTLASGPTSAADVKVMISAGFFKVYSELGPAFEKSTGHKLVTTRGPSLGDSPEAIPARLARGEPADVVIMDGHGTDILDQRGMTLPNSRVPLAESFIGMVVRAGHPKPDISTVEAM